MVHKTDSFNAGFGINLTRSKDDCGFDKKGRRFAISRKAFLSIPIFGVILSILVLKDLSMKYRVGRKMIALRGMLYGSIVGIPLGVALDIVGMVTQVKEWIKSKNITRNL